MQSLKRNYINTFLTKCKQKASTIATVQYCNRHNIKSEYSETHLCQMVHGCSDPQTQWRPLRCFFTVTRIIDSLSELWKLSVCWPRELEFEFTESTIEVHRGEFCASLVRVLQQNIVYSTHSKIHLFWYIFGYRLKQKLYAWLLQRDCTKVRFLKGTKQVPCCNLKAMDTSGNYSK